MRTTTMSDGLHGALVSHLRAERKQATDAIRLIERNSANDWQGIPTRNRREQEERLPRLRIQESRLTEYIDALDEATTH